MYLKAKNCVKLFLKRIRLLKTKIFNVEKQKKYMDCFRRYQFKLIYNLSILKTVGKPYKTALNTCRFSFNTLKQLITLLLLTVKTREHQVSFENTYLHKMSHSP